MVTLQEVGELQGKRHALFPWVPGVTLRELVKALELVGKPPPLGLVGRVLIDAARALSAIAPARAHGGIQDGAMQIGFDGRVSVLDFGAPRVSRFRPIGRVNFSADVFALGGVLHAMLTGFQGDYASPPVTLASPSTSHAEATPAIDDVVLRALSPQPDSRQADAATFADELEAVLGDQLFTTTQVAEVVNTLFKERIKLLHSLGGLTESHPSLEAVLPSSPMAPIPMGTQPAIGGPHPEPPSEPTLPRIALADAPSERTDVRIAAPSDSGSPSRSMLPWDSAEGLTPATDTAPGTTDAATRPSAGPTIGGPRPSSTAVRVSEPETNPRAAAPARQADAETNPRGSAPRPPTPHDTDESSAPRPRASAPRPLGAEDEHAPTRAGGPRALSRSDVEAARPRASAPRPADADADARTTATEVPDDTNPRAVPPRARPADADAELDEPTAATEVVDPTHPRVRPPPQAEFEHRVRNTTEAERYRAKGQERLETPPEGVAAASAVDDEEDEELRNEPTAVRPKVDARMTAQTAQTLPPAPAPASSGGTGLRVVMVLLLLLVIGIAGAVVLKLKRESELPLPVDEPVAEVEVDAGVLEEGDAGAVSAVIVPDLDGGEEEEEEEEEDADGGELDAGAGPDGGAVDAGAADAGAVDAGVDAGVKKPVVKKPVVKKKKKKRRR